MEEDDEDPIVDEVDVFLSKELMEKLFLFQYPMRPSNKPFTNYNHLAARMKPKQKKVELDLSVDTTTSCYARSKGEQIALNVDGPESTRDDAVFGSDLMDRQTLSSTDATPSSSRYAVGVIRDGELHLTPINSILQLRPSFNYLDQADLKVKKKNEKDNEDGDSNDEMEKEDEPKAIKVQFVRKESDIAKARREASYSFHMEKLQQETWITSYYIDKDDPRSSREKEGLFCSAADSANDVSQLSMVPKDYITKLIPESKSDDDAKVQMPNNVLSISQLQTMPLARQVRELMASAKVMRFSQLLHYLSTSFDAANVLKPLQQVAVLVQGCWVIKSEVLYPKDTQSPNTGVPAEIVCRGRDYLMWKFTQSRCVVRKEITSTVKLLSEDVKEILEQMAHPRVKQGWEFREEYDNDFVKQYPEIADRQEKIWEAVYNQLSKIFKIPEEKKKKRKDSGETMEVISGQDRVKAARKRSRSISKSSSKAKAPSHPEDSSRVRHPSSSKDNPSDVEDQDHPKHLNNSETVLGSPESDNHHKALENEELRKFVRTLLRRHFEQEFILDVSEMRRFVSVKLLESPHKSYFSAGISDQALEETALDAGAELLKIAWPSDVEKKKLYGMVPAKDDYCKYRNELVGLFCQGFKYKRVFLFDIITKLEEGEQLTKYEKEKIIRSVCIFKSPYWYLKGSIST